MTASTPTDAPPPPKRRRVPVRHMSLAASVLIVLALAGSVAFVLSEAGLPFVIARIIEQTGGRLSVDVTPQTTVLTGPAVIVATGVLCAEWLDL